MEFTYESYKNMLEKLERKGYAFSDYSTWKEKERSVILRHDIDFSLQKAVRIAEIENAVGCESIYFVLVATNFYNIHSKESRKYISDIIKNGGKIGLHFDETQYNIRCDEEMKKYIYKEADMLSDIIGEGISIVSMHRPSVKILSANIEISGIINSYSEIYFKQMKYLSDSRRCWRENVDEIIDQNKCSRLHILTHPFWYTENKEKNLKQTLLDSISNASLVFYDNLYENIKDLQNEVERAEIERKLDQW